MPYKGAAPGIADLLAGQVQFMFNPIPPPVSQVKAGKLRALGVGSATRSPALPDVPSLAEAGVPGYEYVLWYAMFVPAGTPRNIVLRLNEHVTGILAQPDVVTRFMRVESARLSKVVKAAKIRLE